MESEKIKALEKIIYKIVGDMTLEKKEEEEINKIVEEYRENFLKVLIQ